MHISIEEVRQNIRKQRKLKGISQGALATKLGIAQNTLYRYERGSLSISLDMFLNIADILEVSPEVLLQKEEKSVSYIGNNIRKYRKQKHITQGELAEAIGLKAAAVTKYEIGTVLPPLDKLFSIAAALDVAPDVLLRKEE